MDAYECTDDVGQSFILWLPCVFSLQYASYLLPLRGYRRSKHRPFSKGSDSQSSFRYRANSLASEQSNIARPSVLATGRYPPLQP